MSGEIWILLIAALTAISCSLVGTFLVLRRLSMLGDAISHSILFGIVIAFLVSGSRAPLPMFLGAVIMGLLTAYLTQLLHRFGKLQEDAAVGVVFTFLFAVGVILISLFAGSVDLDQDCVLYGELAFAPLNTLSIGNVEVGPRAFWMLLIATILNLVVITVSYRRLSLISFDPTLAHATGISLQLWHYVLMTLVSITTVAAFESVGAVLVVGLLVIPPATALFFAGSVAGALIISVVIGVLSVWIGFEVAREFDSSLSASMILASAAIFIVTLIGTQLWGWMKRKRAATCF